MGDLIRQLWARKLLIGLTAFLGLAGGVIVAYVSEPVYRATVVVSVASEDQGSSLRSLAGGLGQLAAFAGVQLGSGGGRRAEYVAYLGGKDFTMRFIADRKLAPLLFPKRWDPASKNWRADERVPSIEDAFVIFDRDVRAIREDKATGLVSLSIDAPKPALAAQWANDLIRQANAELRERAKADAVRSIEFLRQELERANQVELRQSIFGLLESQMTTVMLADGQQDYAFRVIDPATAPDEKRFVRPRRALTAALGLLLGALLGMFIVAARSSAAHLWGT